MAAFRPFILLTFVGLAVSTPAPAQNLKKVAKSVTVMSGKQEPIGIFGRVTPQCTNGRVGIRVIETALNGVLTPQKATTKVGAIAKCPKLAAQTAVFFYKPNPKFVGRDRVVIEVRTSDGQAERHVYTIEVR